VKDDEKYKGKTLIYTVTMTRKLGQKGRHGQFTCNIQFLHKNDKLNPKSSRKGDVMPF
jgi:hypothetical protein